jgi:hypothetical protein
MAKKETIKKQEFNLGSLKEKFSSKTKYKPERFLDLGESFTEACGLPGPVMNSVNMFLGHSDSGKTTAAIKAAVNSQKKNILPVFVITEKKWKWERAVQLGLEAKTNEDGVWDGFFLYNDNFEYIEQATDYINSLLDLQEAGELPYGLTFIWDSIGSIPCKMTYDGKGGKMHNASVLADKIGLGIHNRIGKSKKEDYPYDNTLIIINQPWVDTDMQNPMSQPEIKPKGGEAIYLASALVFLFGNQKKSGVSSLYAVKNGRKIKYATRTKISIIKNHVNGLGYADGRVLSTLHGFLNERDIDKYKKEHSSEWNDMLGLSANDDSDFIDEELEDLA